MKKQLSENQIKELENQQYRTIGNHSAVKICGWTKNSLANKGVCYKQIFYGVRSHQCLQMTTSMFCANRCKFCWRGLKAPVSKGWIGEIDTPEFIIEKSIKEHKKLLLGFKGSKKADKRLITEMDNIRHVALSLTGEPITYPRLNELISLFHQKKISTFLVTNGQYPEKIENLADVTQLYLSVDAPNKELLKKIDNPLFSDYWERLIKSLEILKTKNIRTCIRITLIKDENMIEPENYAKLIKIGNPDFVEIKAYMWVGESQKQYKIESMPFSKEVTEFSKKILKFLPKYEFEETNYPSRVDLLMRKSLGKKRFIDFNKFFDLVNNKKQVTKEDYSSIVIMPNN